MKYRTTVHFPTSERNNNAAQLCHSYKSETSILNPDFPGLLRILVHLVTSCVESTEKTGHVCAHMTVCHPSELFSPKPLDPETVLSLPNSKKSPVCTNAAAWQIYQDSSSCVYHGDRPRQSGNSCNLASRVITGTKLIDRSRWAWERSPRLKSLTMPRPTTPGLPTSDLTLSDQNQPREARRCSILGLVRF